MAVAGFRAINATMQNTWQLLNFLKNAERRQLILNSVTEFKQAKDGGIVNTMVLTYQALHDYYRFGNKRLNKLRECVKKRAEAFEKLTNEEKEKSFNAMRDKLLDNVLKMQLTDDFIIHLIKTLGVKGKCRTTAEMAISYMYVMTMMSLWEDFKFKKDDIQFLQKKIKEYVFVIKENDDINICSFMKCLKLECGWRFKSLDMYEKEYGKIDIGPKHAIYELTI